MRHIGIYGSGRCTKKNIWNEEGIVYLKYELTWVLKWETATIPWQSCCMFRGNYCTAFLFEHKVSLSLLVGTLSLLVIVISRLSLCDVLLLVCPCMRSSIRKGTCPPSQRVSFYQSLHLCFFFIQLQACLELSVRSDRQKAPKKSNKEYVYLSFTLYSDG